MPKSQRRVHGCIGQKKPNNSRMIYCDRDNRRIKLWQHIANAGKQYHQPRGIVFASKSFLTLRQQFTPNVEQTCSRSYMHELSCSLQRHISVCSPTTLLDTKRKKEKKKQKKNAWHKGKTSSENRLFVNIGTSIE